MVLGLRTAYSAYKLLMRLRKLHYIPVHDLFITFDQNQT